MIIPEKIYSTVANKCPRCHQGKVFENNNPYSFKNGIKMNESCSECHLKYEKEPGFFYGALYVSYAFSSGIFITLYLLDAIWIHMDTALLLTLIITAIIGFYPIVLRWGRTMWLNFFVRYDKKYSKKGIKYQEINQNNFQHQ
ncbi:MAG: DUF983 domain-containing protein [Bacteroidota bacterium]|nr:DUF983 domain-containing protein [Bacteroidota bacterium]